METLTKSISLTEIVYPVFKIGTEQPLFEEGVVLYIYYYHKDDDIVIKYHIVDDRNLPGDTLAKRRLSLVKDGVKIKKLTRAVFFLGDLIKVAKPNIWMIDSVGNVFRYKKSKSVKLVYKPIKQIIPIKTGGAIIEVHGITSRFKCLYKPNSNIKYAGVIEYGMSYILYDLSTEQFDSTRRMI